MRKLIRESQHALAQGMNHITILSNDTDVVIIALGIYHKLRAKYQFDDIVIAFGRKSIAPLVSRHWQKHWEKLGAKLCHFFMH